MVNSYKNALRKLWDGLCDVYIRETIVNQANGRDEPVETCVLQGEPCRLSFTTISSTKENSEAALIQQVVKLFIDKDVDIPEGSKIVVTQEGKTGNYCRTGKPALYSSHQEIVLEHFKEWV